jgi:triosephosphate isomerase
MTKAPPSKTSSRRSPTSSGSTPTGRSSSTATSTPSVPARSVSSPQSPTDDAPLGLPLFLLNLKAYEGWLGARADQLGKALEAERTRRGVRVALAPATTDLGRLASVLTVPVLAQHADYGPAGARTGYVVPESVRASGGAGALVNHSEHPLTVEEVGWTVGRLRGLGLAAVVCAGDAAQAATLAQFHPPYLAVEPPELIGGPRSVSTARPEVIVQTVEAVHRVAPLTHVLCGAGIQGRDDVARALELGSEGILVASAVTRAKDPRAALADLLDGFG